MTDTEDWGQTPWSRSEFLRLHGCVQSDRANTAPDARLIVKRKHREQARKRGTAGLIIIMNALRDLPAQRQGRRIQHVPYNVGRGISSRGRTASRVATARACQQHRGRGRRHQRGGDALNAVTEKRGNVSRKGPRLAPGAFFAFSTRPTDTSATLATTVPPARLPRKEARARKGFVENQLAGRCHP